MNLKVHVHAPRHARKVAVAVHLRLRVLASLNAAVGVVVVDRVIRVVRQLLVEVDRVGLQPHHRLVHAEVGDLGRRVPGRAAGQLVPLHEHHVRPALLRQMVQRGAARDAAPDHYGFGPRFHALALRR